MFTSRSSCAILVAVNGLRVGKLVRLRQSWLYSLNSFLLDAFFNQSCFDGQHQGVTFDSNINNSINTTLLYELQKYVLAHSHWNVAYSLAMGRLVIMPKTIPVLPEIMRACLKVMWLNIFIDCQVFIIILTYITYVTLTSLKSPFESNSIQANRRQLI